VKAALYYPWLYLTSGAERTVLELTGHSRHDWTIFTNRFEPDHTFPGFAERKVVVLPEVSVRRSILPAAAAGWRLLTQRLPLEGFDALLVVCEGLGDLAVFRSGDVPTVCLCLTPLRIAFDPVYRERYLDGKALRTRLATRAAAAGFRAVDRLAWRQYRRAVCISEEVRGRVRRGRLAGDDRLEVQHVGVTFPEEKPAAFERFFLLPGRIMWTKNVELGIEAFRRMVGEHPDLADFRLVVAGIVDRKSEPYLEGLRALAADPRIEFRVLPSDEDLAALYRSCRAVLFTAFNEDWGIVPLEAMRFGKPVIATDRGGPRESVQHGVQGFLEEPRPDAFAARMAELARDPGRARALGRAGHERARLFSWDAFAQRLDAVMDDAVARPAAAGRGAPGLAAAPRSARP
jgi:glycosyltransferase involved in cell wall biosynthesis